MVAPDSCLDEVHSHLLLSLVLYRKPDFFETVQLIDELKERPSLQHFVAVLVFDVGEHLEEAEFVDLRISEDVSERVGESGFYFEERLQGHLVDGAEALSIEV